MYKRRAYLWIIILCVSLFIYSCSKKQNEEENSRKKGGDILEHQKKPLRGEVTLSVEKIFSFDPSKTNPDALQIGSVEKDPEGNYYFISYAKCSILKYSKNGKFIKSFLSKGVGPGELRFVSFFKILNNYVYVADSQKIIKYDLNGIIVSEKRIKPVFSNVEVVSDSKYIAVYYDRQEKSQKSVLNIKKALGLFDTKSNLLMKYVSTTKTGMIKMIFGKSVTVFNISGISPDLKWAYDRNKKIIYYGLTDRYNIFAVNLKGEPIFSFGRECIQKTLSSRDKERIVGVFSSMSKKIRQTLKKQIPDKAMYFSFIEVLPSGYIAVYEPAIVSEDSFDVFNDTGVYVYRLKLPAGIDLDGFQILNNGNLGYLKENDSGVVFTEYKVKSPSELFSEYREN